ncbi:MAG: hypothetical protein ABIH48_00065, partial [Candidatus Falkowbacteria bacterium]
NYLNYINDLKSIIDGFFYQLINGSFITQKTKPSDIDIVTFADYKKLESKYESMKFLLTHSKQHYMMDGYFAPVCTTGHFYYKKAIEIEKYWLNLFGKSREDKTGNRYSKGIIKISFLK